LAAWFQHRPIYVDRGKSAVRRSHAPSPVECVWHQDATFFEPGTETLNVWCALEACGVDAPGLECVARRVLEHLPRRGAAPTWSVDPALVSARFQPEIAVPAFAAGDVLLFDQWLIHRTHSTQSMRQSRDSFEAWLFPHSHAIEATPQEYARLPVSG
jgi:ectoine hydroxylase-related dioxygenase (phytanoyl-CoA dioxygenase family)